MRSESILASEIASVPSREPRNEMAAEPAAAAAAPHDADDDAAALRAALAGVRSRWDATHAASKAPFAALAAPPPPPISLSARLLDLLDPRALAAVSAAEVRAIEEKPSPLPELRELLREHSAQLSELYELARRGRALAATAPAATAEIAAALRPYERELQLKQSVVRSLEYRSAARDALSGTKSQALVEAWNAQPMLAELPEPDRDG